MAYDDMNMVFLTDEQLAFVEAEKKKAVKEFARKLKETEFKQGNEMVIYSQNIDIILAEALKEPN